MKFFKCKLMKSTTEAVVMRTHGMVEITQTAADGTKYNIMLTTDQVGSLHKKLLKALGQ